ncbi:MAG: ATP-binding protein [Cyanobacteria bacterium SBLK]|nr:ATP-binding protein [Cyanobacteria bacterium SBLK]
MTNLDVTSAREKLLNLHAQLLSQQVQQSNLERLCQQFQLSNFERDILLLCLGQEIKPQWANLCAIAQNNPKQTYPTFNLALTIFENRHMGALTPNAPLRYWQFIEVEKGRILTQSPLKIDEWVFHYLFNSFFLDKRLEHLVESVISQYTLVQSHQQLVQQLLQIWQENKPPNIPIVQLCGQNFRQLRAIAATSCEKEGRKLYAIASHLLPTDTEEFTTFLRLWEREFLLQGSVLLIEIDDIYGENAAKQQAISLFINRLQTPIIIATRDRLPPRRRSLLTFEVESATLEEQRENWHIVLDHLETSDRDPIVKAITAQFNLNLNTIESVGAIAKSNPNLPQQELQKQLWESCRIQARPQLADLAQRIESKAILDDLILPQKQKEILQEIVGQIRYRTTVYYDFGFASKGARGLGITALFAGQSGTGKTMAAEVLAKELAVDLYRIDLSRVVSKYIGETEKNLRRIFDAAETGGAILLFDEADALFGKRSEVKDSRDRYANLEVSYLLQRMEEYQGLAILTTNLKDAIDNAFLRRIRFIVDFPFPLKKQRRAIWQRVFPPQTPTLGLDYRKLAQLDKAGGIIRNIAINAVFLAMNEGGDRNPVTMQHILKATRNEYDKLHEVLTDAEIKDWVE